MPDPTASADGAAEPARVALTPAVAGGGALVRDFVGEIGTRLRFVGAAAVLDDLAPLLTRLNHRPLPTQGEPADVLIVDGAHADAFDLCRTTATPTILVGGGAGFDHRRAAVRAGVTAILRSPVDAAELADWLARLGERPTEETPSILIVDDDDLAAELCAERLRAEGMRVTVLCDPTAVIAALDAGMFDLVLMDLYMPEVSGIELARMIRLSHRHLCMPIVFLSAEQDAGTQLDARRHGADDFISKRTDAAALVALVKVRVERTRALRALIERDGLTGLLDHARFRNRVADELARSRRTGSPSTLAMIDLDHFKRVNDGRGHQTGDRVIRHVAHALSGWLRRTDVVGRYGGEEFGALLLDAAPEDAVRVIDGFRDHVAHTVLDGGSAPFSITLSAGIAGSRDWPDLEDLVAAADAALYRAKHNGRDDVVLALAGADGRPRFRSFRAVAARARAAAATPGGRARRGPPPSPCIAS